MNIFTKERIALELNHFRGVRTEGEWVKVRAVMDSGASESVAPPDMCPLYPINESEGSKAGVKYRTASNTSIPNLGEQTLNVFLEDGRETKVKYNIADVSRLLNSISEICDGGNQEIFGKGGGIIFNLENGNET